MDQLKKKRKKGIAVGMKVTLVSFLTLLCLGLTGTLGYYIFQLTKVQFVGNETIPTEILMERVDVRLGQSLFAMDTRAIGQELGEMVFIEVKSVERVLPDTLKITIRERNMRLAIRYADNYIMVDEDGTAVSTVPSLEGLVEVRGVNVDAIVMGSKIPALDEYILYSLVEILSAFENSVIGKEISYINLANPISVEIGVKNGLRIRIGKVETKEMETKLRWIETMYPRLTEEGKKFGILDISGKYGASYLYE